RLTLPKKDRTFAAIRCLPESGCSLVGGSREGLRAGHQQVSSMRHVTNTFERVEECPKRRLAAAAGKSKANGRGDIARSCLIVPNRGQIFSPGAPVGKLTTSP